MATGADADGVGFGQAGLAAGVGTVTVCAIACRARMRELGGLDFFCLVVMACHAEGFGIGLREDDFAIFGRRMAGIATIALEGRVLKPREKFG